MANPIAVPGTSVPSSSLVTPGGAQGTTGIQGPIGPNAVSTDAGNQATLGSDSKIFVPDPTPTITSVRLRSFNAVGNANFEVDQIDCGTIWNNAGNVSTKGLDRWFCAKTGTMQLSQQQIAANVVVPGTNFLITQKINHFVLTTTEASLAAADMFQIWQAVEGPLLRELINDVTSVSILCRSSVANLAFSMTLQDSSGAYNLPMLCTLGAANTWTLITLPNLPIWAAGGTFPLTPGSLGYYLVIVLAAGSSKMAATANVWNNVTGAFGAPGMSNFAASPVNSTFDLAFVQHEAGSRCTQLMDLPFDQNLWQCYRYFQKTNPYSTLPGNTTSPIYGLGIAAVAPWTSIRFIRPMVKTPVITTYGTAANTANVNGTQQAITGTIGLSETGFGGVNLTTTPGANYYYWYAYIADSGM